MFRVRISQSTNLQSGSFTVLLVLLALIPSCRGQNQVIGPSQPIVATVGEDVVLPCSLKPAVNAFGMTVEWTRPDLNRRFVYVWRDGVELENKKHPSYVGRTSVFTDQLVHGNVSLKLSNVKISDEGRYRCFIPDFSADAAVRLVVGAASSPVINMTKSSSGLVLQCESKGWYPEPEVLWLDGERNLLPAGPPETVRGPDDLYTVSSRVTVEKRHSYNFTCRVQQKNINQSRETQIHVPDHFFVVPGTPGTPDTPSSLPVIIGSIVCAVLILAVVFIVWKWRQKRSKNKRRSLEDGGEQTDAKKTVTSKSDNTGSHFEMKGEGESEPLMAGREEDNNVDNRGEEEVESESEHKDPQSVSQRETNQDQLVINPELIRDMDSAEGEMEIKSINNEKVPLIPTEGETQQKQDLTGRHVKNDWDKGEGEQMMKPVKEYLGLPVVVEEQKVQPQNLQTDQDVQKEEETQQEQLSQERPPMNDVDKKKAKPKKKPAKKENKQEKPKKISVAEQRKQQREQELLEEERQREENDRKLHSDKKRKEKDEKELKSQRGDGEQHLVEDQKQEESKAEPEGKKEKDLEGNQSDIATTTESKAENQKEKIKETEVKPPLVSKEVMARREEENNVDNRGKEEIKSESEHEDPESSLCQLVQQMNLKEAELKPPLVSKEVTKRPDLKIHQETAEKKKQELQKENELQTEKQEEEKSQRNQEETKERSTKGAMEEGQERWEEGTDKGPGVDDTQRTSKEMEQGRLQHMQQPYVKEDDREQPEESVKFLPERGGECQEGQQDHTAKTDRRPDIDETQNTPKEMEKQLIGEKQQEEKSLRNQEGTKNQPEQSIKGVNVECKERQEEGTDKGTDIDETLKTKEMEKEELLQDVQQPHIKEPEQPEDSINIMAGRRDDCQKELQEEATKIERRPDTDETQKTSKEMEQRGQLQAVQQPDVNREQPEESFRSPERGAECYEVLQQEEGMEIDNQEDRLQTQKEPLQIVPTRTPTNCPEELNEDQMEVQEAGYMEQKVIDEAQRQYWNSQTPMCQVEEEPMET